MRTQLASIGHGFNQQLLASEASFSIIAAGADRTHAHAVADAGSTYQVALATRTRDAVDSWAAGQLDDDGDRTPYATYVLANYDADLTWTQSTSAAGAAQQKTNADADHDLAVAAINAHQTAGNDRSAADKNHAVAMANNANAQVFTIAGANLTETEQHQDAYQLVADLVADAGKAFSDGLAGALVAVRGDSVAASSAYDGEIAGSRASLHLQEITHSQYETVAQLASQNQQIALAQSAAGKAGTEGSLTTGWVSSVAGGHQAHTASQSAATAAADTTGHAAGATRMTDDATANAARSRAHAQAAATLAIDLQGSAASHVATTGAAWTTAVAAGGAADVGRNTTIATAEAAFHVAMAQDHVDDLNDQFGASPNQWQQWSLRVGAARVAYLSSASGIYITYRTETAQNSADHADEIAGAAEQRDNDLATAQTDYVSTTHTASVTHSGAAADINAGFSATFAGILQTFADAGTSRSDARNNTNASAVQSGDNARAGAIAARHAEAANQSVLQLRESFGETLTTPPSHQYLDDFDAAMAWAWFDQRIIEIGGGTDHAVADAEATQAKSAADDGSASEKRRSAATQVVQDAFANSNHAQRAYQIEQNHIAAIRAAEAFRDGQIPASVGAPTGPGSAPAATIVEPDTEADQSAARDAYNTAMANDRHQSAIDSAQGEHDATVARVIAAAGLARAEANAAKAYEIASINASADYAIAEIDAAIAGLDALAAEFNSAETVTRANNARSARGVQVAEINDRRAVDLARVDTDHAAIMVDIDDQEADEIAGADSSFAGQTSYADDELAQSLASLPQWGYVPTIAVPSLPGHSVASPSVTGDPDQLISILTTQFNPAGIGGQPGFSFVASAYGSLSDQLIAYASPAIGAIGEQLVGVWNGASDFAVEYLIQPVRDTGHYLWNDGLDHANNFFAGFADTLTLGATAAYRDALGVGHLTDTSSGLYMGGQVAGVAVGIGLGVGGVGTAGTIASLYTQGSTIAGMGIAIHHLADGTATVADALAFAPIGGTIARRLVRLRGVAPLAKTGGSLPVIQPNCFVAGTAVMMAGPDPSTGGQLIDADQQPPLMLAGLELNRQVIASLGVLVIGASVIQNVQSTRRRREEELAENTDDFFVRFGEDEDEPGDDSTFNAIARDTTMPRNEVAIDDESAFTLPKRSAAGGSTRRRPPSGRATAGVSTTAPGDPPPPKTSSAWKPMIGSLAGSLLLLTSLLWTEPPADQSESVQATTASLRASQPETHLRPIEQVRLGERVHTDITPEQAATAVEHPELLPDWDRPDHQIDPEQWRQIDLSVPKSDGHTLAVSLLRPATWLSEHEAVAGSRINLVMPEMGIDGPATVLRVSDCPEIQPGSGSVVTGSFAHRRGGVLRVRLAGIEEPLGVTDNHPVYSLDREDFVPAGELAVGERLAVEGGETVIESIVAQQDAELVFNLEVQGEHVYRVTERGLLVHNNCLYRGVPLHAGERSRLAAQGLSRPRGTRLDLDALERHVRGTDIASGVTSWSTSIEQARRFAGSNGYILRVNADDVADKIVQRPDIGKYLEELEVLLRGTIQGEVMH